MSHSNTAATRQYEMKLNITLPAMLAGAAVRAARATPPDVERLLSESAMQGFHVLRSAMQNAMSVPRLHVSCNCLSWWALWHHSDDSAQCERALCTIRFELFVQIAWCCCP